MENIEDIITGLTKIFQESVSLFSLTTMELKGVVPNKTYIYIRRGLLVFKVFLYSFVIVRMLHLLFGKKQDKYSQSVKVVLSMAVINLIITLVVLLLVQPFIQKQVKSEESENPYNTYNYNKELYDLYNDYYKNIVI